jgi:hypothetical protein
MVKGGGCGGGVGGVEEGGVGGEEEGGVGGWGGRIGVGGGGAGGEAGMFRASVRTQCIHGI